MSFTPYTFNDGDVLSAAELNAVEDELVALDAVATNNNLNGSYKSSSATLNNTAGVWRLNNIVFFQCQIQVKADIASGTAIITGLPTAKITTFLDAISMTDYATHYTFRILKNGSNMSYYHPGSDAIPNLTSVFIHGFYIVADDA